MKLNRFGRPIDVIPPERSVQQESGVPEGHDDAAKRSEGSEPSRSEAASSSGNGAAGLWAVVPNPEIPDKVKPRKFTAEYKLRILAETEKAAPGQIGGILRREGLYSSHLATWRGERKRGSLAALAPKQRGPQPKSSAEVENEKLRGEVERLQEELRKARLIIDVQKKLALMLGSPIEDESNEGRNSL